MSGVLKKLDSNNKINLAIIVSLLVAFALIGRLLPHPPNFAPVAAIAIFGGAVLPKRLALTLPLLVMIVSDLIIGLHGVLFWTWGSFVAIGWMSYLTLNNKFKLLNTAKMTLWASVFFYFVTNFGVWLQGLLYPLTFDGLAQSYYNAIPFFKNTLAGDASYVGAIFGLYYLATRLAGITYRRSSKSSVGL